MINTRECRRSFTGGRTRAGAAVITAAVMLAGLLAPDIRGIIRVREAAPLPVAQKSSSAPRPDKPNNRRARRRASGAETTNAGVEGDDLSGTYTGTISEPTAGLAGDATLTIKGEQFTLTTGSTVYTGRIEDVTASGRKAVSLQFENTTSSAGGQAAVPPTALSLELARSGDQFTFSSLAGDQGAVKAPSAGKKKRARRAPKPKSR